MATAVSLSVPPGAAALPYFRTCLEHLLLVKDDPSVASICSRTVQRAHERIKQCYVAFFENKVGGGARAEEDSRDDGVNGAGTAQVCTHNVVVVSLVLCCFVMAHD